MAKLDQEDLDAIKNLIELVLEEKINEDLDKLLDEKLFDLRSRIFDYITAFAKEISDNREERTVQSAQILRNTRRIEKLEKAVFN